MGKNLETVLCVIILVGALGSAVALGMKDASFQQTPAGAKAPAKK